MDLAGLVAKDVFVADLLASHGDKELVIEDALHPIVEGHEAEQVRALLDRASIAVDGAVEDVEALDLGADRLPRARG